MKHLLLAGALALALTGCASVPPNYSLQAKRVEASAEGTFNAAAKAYYAVCPNPPEGVALTPRCAQGDKLRVQAYAALLVVRKAVGDGQVPDTSRLIAIAAELRNLSKDH